MGDQSFDRNNDGKIEGDERSDLEVLEEWLTAARASGKEVLISFEHTRPGEYYCHLPTRDQYREGVRAFREAFPWIMSYTAWNEPNHQTQPTSRTQRSDGSGMRQAGRYWRDMMRECQRSRAATTTSPALMQCSVGAGDFLDDSTFSRKRYDRESGSKTFNQYVDGLGDQEPTVWAWHPYSAGYEGEAPPLAGSTVRRNLRRSSDRFQRFVEATRSRGSKKDPLIWLTEFGGRVDQHRDPNYDGKDRPTSETRANADLNYLLTLPFKDFTASSSRPQGRVTRVYPYAWLGDAECGHDSNRPCASSSADEYPFDSGLLNVDVPDRRPRAMYYTYKGRSNP